MADMNHFFKMSLIKFQFTLPQPTTTNTTTLRNIKFVLVTKFLAFNKVKCFV